MSFENKAKTRNSNTNSRQNLYHLLGNDVEDESAPNLGPIREVVRNKPSSKKTDVPPPSADPNKAKKKTKASGNEGALKSKNDNKSVSAPSTTPSKHYKKPMDRHSRSTKTDSSKKIRQGWGDDRRELDAEKEADEDATKELEDENADSTTEDAKPKQSLSDYFAELELKQKELDGNRNIRPANSGDDKWVSEAEKIEKQQTSYVPPSSNRKLKNKQPKEKKFLNFEASFSDQPNTTTSNSSSSSAPRDSPRDSKRGGFNSRGAKRGGFSGKKFEKKTEKPVVNDKNFPSL